jgi:hypothetical protein
VVALGRLRDALIVFVGLVLVLALLGGLGAQVGTTGLLVLVCLAVLAYAALRLRNRSSN